MEEKKYIIYKHTNKTNGKVYIGQTSQEPERRWQKGKGYFHNNHFTSAIEKYGWENFDHEIILKDLNQEQMKYWEEYYIEFYDARNPEKGYNINRGGQVSPFSELWKTKEFREKISKQQSELMKKRLKEDPKEKERLEKISKEFWETHPEKRKEYSERMSKFMKEKWQDEEYRKKQSEAMKDLWKKEEIREKLIEQTKINAKNNWKNSEYRKKMCKSVINVETGLVFESGAAAGRWCGVDRSTITRALKTGKQGGKHPETKKPLHWVYADKGGDE